MARFYKTYLGRLLLGFLILLELERTQGKDAVVQAVSQWQPQNDMQRRWIRDGLAYYINDYPDESPRNEDVLAGVFGQLDKTKKQEGDLIDTVVEMLRLPFCSYLSGDGLRRLREIILNPGELKEFRSKATKAGVCSCGHEFRTGEIITVVDMEGDELSLQCHKCQRPSMVRCDYCDEMIAITGKVAQNLRNKIDCGCQKRAENEASRAANGLTPQQARIAERMRARQRGVPVGTNPITLRQMQQAAQATQMPGMIIPNNPVGVPWDVETEDDGL